MAHVFQTISRIVYGPGSAANAAEEVRRLGGSRVMVIMDKFLATQGLDAPVTGPLREKGIAVECFSDIAAEPMPDSILACAEKVKAFKADVILGLGGGSALDSAKAAAVMAVYEPPLEQYFGMEIVPGPCLPTILIPTTAGTGSEITSISVVGDPASDSKKGIVSDHLYAKSVILDPELTCSLPPRFTAYTGLDAFVHAMESYVNLSATPITEGMALQAMRLIADNIRMAYANGGNVEARGAMLYGSAIAGMTFSNTQNGIIHALGMAAPAHYHLPHGLLMAALAPMGIAYNSMAAPEKYAKVAEILGCCPCGKNLFEQAASAAEGFTKLMTDLNVTPGLAAHGVQKEDLRGIAERAAASKRLMDGNPRKATADDLEALLIKNF